MREGAAVPLAAAPVPQAMPPLPPPRAEAAARPILSRAGAAGRRRARYLGAGVAVVALALLSGLAFVGPPPPDGPAQPRAYETVPAPPPPAEPPQAAPVPPAPLPEPGPPQPRPTRAAETAPRPPAARSPEQPRPARAAPGGAATFRGTVFNETLRQGGRLMLSIRPADQPGAVSVRFEASAGLIGSGELSGTLDTEGHLAAFGTLLMGRNPHETELRGTISGDSLSGAASFRRPAMTTGRTRSTFRLARE